MYGDGIISNQFDSIYSYAVISHTLNCGYARMARAGQTADAARALILVGLLRYCFAKSKQQPPAPSRLLMAVAIVFSGLNT